MTLFRSLLVFALLAPLTTHAAIDLDDDDGGGGGGGDGGGGDTGGDVGPIWSKTYANSALFGTSRWGAGYKLDGSVSATAATRLTNDKLAATMGLETYSKLNGGYYRVFSVRTSGATEAKRRTDVSINAYAGPANVYSRSWGSTSSTLTFLNATPLSLSTTFLSKSVTVTALFVPVTFTVKATGAIGATLTGKISNIGLEAAGTPSGRAGLYTSAAVGGKYCVSELCVGASAGVYTDVTLVKASAPAKVAAWWQLARPSGVFINYTAKADMTMTSLDGELGIYAEACLGGCVSDSTKLIDWPGLTATYSIANMNGSQCIIGDCSFSTPSFPLEQ